MVSVAAKADTDRRARATGAITMQPETLHAIVGDTIHKGDVIAVARIAGIQAAKRTAELIPLCHSVPLTDIQVNVATDETLPGLRVEAVVRSVGKTGVEMEALTAVAVTLLTVYDMAKSIDRSMVLVDVRLDEKSGGRHGDWARQ